MSVVSTKQQRALRSIVEPGFEAHLLDAAIDNLASFGPLCFNNFSYALRELLRHVLHRLAPDEDIAQCVWFKPTKNVANGITRADRATYAVQGGLSDAYVSKKLGVDIRKARADLLKAIETLSKYTHVEPSTFGLSKLKTAKLANECLEATVYFIERISDLRKRVLEAVRQSVDKHLLDRVISESVDSLDELATHHFVDEIDVHTTQVVEIRSTSLKLRVTGNVSVGLQYGSDSDVKNDMGVVTGDFFPFTAQITIALKRPLGREGTVDTFTVDTMSFYE